MTSASAAWNDQIGGDNRVSALAPAVLVGGARRSNRPSAAHLQLLDRGTHLSRVQDAPTDLVPRFRRLPLRALDIVGAVVGLVLLSPILLVVGLSIWRSSPGPVIFRQTRVGRGGETFTCLKFRSMYVDAAERLEQLLGQPDFRTQWEADQKLRFDPRITPIGRLIRRLDLDELPQLWNVLRGDMSLVGPRPVLTDEAERYGTRLDTVLSVRPGMTGLWQISGRNELSYSQRIEIDVCYVTVQSVLFNLAIISRTAWLIVTSHNGSW